MNITDDTLSAYLDKQLSAADMALIKARIAGDSELAARLADIQQADDLLRKASTLIDQYAMPDNVLEMLKHSPGQAKVISLSAWQQRRQHLNTFFREHAAMAASVALVIGFGSGLLLSDNPLGTDLSDTSHSALSAVLSSAISGQVYPMSTGGELLSHFSFLANGDQLCRQYSVQTQELSSDQIACRVSGEWRVIATLNSYAAQDADAYLPASADSVLDTLLDQLMTGQPLTLEQERARLQR